MIDFSIADEIKQADPMLDAAVYFDDLQNKYVLLCKDTFRASWQNWSEDQLSSYCTADAVVKKVVSYFDYHRKKHPDPYPGGVQGPLNIRMGASVICPCGISRFDCSYHNPLVK